MTLPARMGRRYKPRHFIALLLRHDPVWHSRNGVWLVDAVPPGFLAVLQE